MENRKQALKDAIQSEIKAQNLYRILSEAFRREELSETFKNLVALEKIHEEKLIERFVTDYDEQPEPLDRKAVFRFSSKRSLSDPVEILRFAAGNETDAMTKYRNLGEDSESEDARMLFFELAEEEENHRRLLEDEVARIQGEMMWYDESELNGLMED